MIKIRKARPQDVPVLARIEKASFDSPWSADEIAKDVASEDDSIYLAMIESDGVKAGYGEMRMVAGEAQIYNIAIDPAFRCRGLGEELMRHLAGKAEELGCGLITLEVRSGNEAATGLYRKLGFREVGRRKAYYQEGNEDAVLMDLEL